MRPSLPRIALVAALVAASSSCVIIDDDEASLTVHNHSSYVLTEVRLAEVDDWRWGPNLLPDVLYPSEDLVIDHIECGDYDVLVVDETGVDCVLPDLWLCFDDEHWVITDGTLERCAFPY